MNKDDLVVFSTEKSFYFAQLIAQGLGLSTVSDIEREKFGDGERYYRVGIKNREDLFGKTVIFVGSTHTDNDIEELYRVGSALAGYGTKQRIFVIPFFGYSTMERAVKPGEVVTAKTIARQLSGIPNSGLGNTFLMFDLHVSGLVHYFEGDCLRAELYGGPTFVDALEMFGLVSPLSKFVSADLGRPYWVKYYAKQFKTGTIAVVDKDREMDQTKVVNVIGNVEGRDLIIYDDMSRSFGTLIDAVEAYLEAGAKSVKALLSHLAIYGEDVVAKIEASPLELVVASNSHPMSQLKSVEESLKFLTVDVSPIFVNTIRKQLNI